MVFFRPVRKSSALCYNLIPLMIFDDGEPCRIARKEGSTIVIIVYCFTRVWALVLFF